MTAENQETLWLCRDCDSSGTVLSAAGGTPLGFTSHLASGVLGECVPCPQVLAPGMHGGQLGQVWAALLKWFCACVFPATASPGCPLASSSLNLINHGWVRREPLFSGIAPGTVVVLVIAADRVTAAHAQP